jgi:integrase
VDDVPAGQWWGSIVAWFWHTAERTEATLTGVRMENLVDDTIVIDAEYRKGRRKPMSYRLPPELVEQMRHVQQDGCDVVWHWPAAISTFYDHWREIYERAGLKYTKFKTGPHQIRKTHASHLEAAGGNATESLGHSSRSVTKGSYLDTRIATPPNFASMLPSIE